MNTWSDLIEKIVQRPKKYLIAFAVLLLLSLSALVSLQNDPNPEILPITHEARVLHEAIKEEYTGTKDHIAILMEVSENQSSIFEFETLTRLQAIVAEVRNIDVVLDRDIQLLKDIDNALGENAIDAHGKFLAAKTRNEKSQVLDELRMLLELESDEGLLDKFYRFQEHFTPIIKISSLFDTDNIIGKDNTLLIKTAIEEVPSDKEALQKLRAEISSNQLFQSLLISKDLKKTGIFVEINIKVEDSKASYLFYDKLKQIIRKNPGNEKVYIAGTPVTTANIAHVIDADMGKLFPIVLVLVIACLWLKFRMGRGIFIPLLVVIGAIVMTLAIQSLFDVPINVISSALPVFLISIGIADGVHIYSEYRDHRVAGMSNQDAVRGTLKNLGMPVIATSVTTALAFFSLGFTEIVQIKHFGIFVGVGAILAMALSLFMVPALILILKEKQETEIRTNLVDVMMNGFLGKMTEFSLAKPWRVILLVTAVLALSVVGVKDLVVDNNRVAFFQEASEIVLGAEAHNEKLSGTENINIIFTSTENAFNQPDNLKFITHLQEAFVNHDKVGKITSIVDLLERMNEVIVDEGAKKIDWDSIDSNLISQYMLLYENSGGDLLSDFIVSDYSQANVRVNITSNSSNDVKRLVDDLNSYLEQHLPANLSYEIGGSGVVLIAAGDEIINGQLQSFVISIAVVLVLLIFVFRSLIYALIGTAPLIIASTINFGLMGATGIPVDIGTAIITSVAIGVGVDFSIHYLSRIRSELRVVNDFDEAARRTINNSGVAIASNAMVVGIGFLALLASEFVPINNIGWIVSLTMFSSCLLTLFLTPSLLKILYGKNVGKIGPGNSGTRIVSHIVMIGSGYISFYSYQELRKVLRKELRRGDVKVTVVSPDNHHVFHGFIGEMITGVVPVEHTLSPNRKIFHGADMVSGRVVNIDSGNQEIKIRLEVSNEEMTMHYDHLLIGAGATTDCSSVPGMVDHCWTLRKRGRVLGFRNHLIRTLEKAGNIKDPKALEKALTVVVAGGGFAGVEMSAAIAEFFKKMRPYYPVLNQHKPTIVLVHSGNEILPELQERFTRLVRYARKQLDALHIDLRLNTRVSKVEEGRAFLSDNTVIEADTLLSTLGNLTVTIPGTEHFEKDEINRLKADTFLRVNGFENIWTGGDIANITHHYTKKACPTNALWAIKEGRYLARNLARAIRNKPLKPFTYWGLGQAASLGTGKGMAELYTVQLTGWIAYISRIGFFLYFMPGKRQTFEVLMDHFKLIFLDGFMVPVEEDKIASCQAAQK